MNTLFKKLATGTAALALMTTAFSASAMAAEVGTTIKGEDNVVVESFDTTSTFEPVTLTGVTQLLEGASLSGFTVKDARGTGAGWEVSVTASPFTHDGDKGSLQPGALTISKPTVAMVEESNSSDAGTISTIGGVIDRGELNVLEAAAEGGMGTYNVSGTELKLKLMPKEVYAGTYTSTITVGLASGPDGE